MKAAMPSVDGDDKVMGIMMSIASKSLCATFQTTPAVRGQAPVNYQSLGCGEPKSGEADSDANLKQMLADLLQYQRVVNIQAKVRRMRTRRV
jgi:hypothetical protein